MAYDEETRKSRVVVQTPESRREVVRTERQYAPERNGMSSAMVAVLVIVSVAVVGLLVLFLTMRMQTDANDNANLASREQPPQTTVVQQPAQQPPVIVQAPAPATQTAPIIDNPPASTGGTTPGAPDDGAIQAAIAKSLQKDPTLSALGIIATVTGGRVTLTGTVRDVQLKDKAERLARTVKGVKAVDNQIVVISA